MWLFIELVFKVVLKTPDEIKDKMEANDFKY